MICSFELSVTEHCYIPAIPCSHVLTGVGRIVKLCGPLGVGEEAWKPALGDQSHTRDPVSEWDFILRTVDWVRGATFVFSIQKHVIGSVCLLEGN